MNAVNYHKVLRHIEAHPEEWTQSDRCKCFMAHASQFYGRPPGYGQGNEGGCEFIGIDYWDDQFRWLFGSLRSLDDFRTLGRTLRLP